MRNRLSMLLVATYCIALLLMGGPRVVAAADGAAAPVRLTAVPAGATAAQIQDLIQREPNLYFPPGEYHVGTIRIEHHRGGILFGAGRMTTKLIGQFSISDTTGLTICNLSLSDPTVTPGHAMLDVTGPEESKVSLISVFASAGVLGYPGGKLSLTSGGTAIRMAAPGEMIVQGVHINGSDVGLSVENPGAWVGVIGGNYQAERLHIRQLQGHLEVRAVGTQLAFGGADVEINAPSPHGFHLVEAIRTEGSNGQRADDTLIRVPATSAKVDVALRTCTLGGMTRYADYNANGTLALIANANFPDWPEQKPMASITSRSPGIGRIVSVGNKLGNSFDSSGAFDIAGDVSVLSIGDLWNVYVPGAPQPAGTRYDEPVTADGLKKMGRPIPSNVTFAAERQAVALSLRIPPRYRTAAMPTIANLGDLMLNVRDFGANPGDGIDDSPAIQKAIDAALMPGGVSKPLYFPPGRYELATPLLLDHFAGGGLFGDGPDKSILVSTSGKGVIRSDGAGYSTFVGLGFENPAGAASTTVYMGLWNNHAKDKQRHPDTGASLQANMFYRTCFEGGAIGLAVGTPGGAVNEDGSPADGAGQMGDGFMVVDSIFRNIHLNGAGAGYASQNYNTLTNPIVDCRFENVDLAAVNESGSFNCYGVDLSHITTAGVLLKSVVSDGFTFSHITLDSSAVPLLSTAHSSSPAHVIVENCSALAAKGAKATQYAIGGSVVVLQSKFPERTLSSGGGIGDNALIVEDSLAPSVDVSGRAHAYTIKIVGTEKSQ